MKNSIKYLKNMFKVLVWPIIFTIGQFLIQYIFVANFNNKEKLGHSDIEFLEYIKTMEYQEKLNTYMNSMAILIVLITMIIFIPILTKVYKKYKRKNDFKIKDIFIPMLMGISISLIYNITLYNLNKVVNFTDIFNSSPLPMVVQIISSGICGPILEELIFRGIVYNKLKTFNKPMTAIILTSIIFGVIHGNFVNIIYTFGVSFILIYLYEKYKTLKASIIMHMFLNTTIILVLPLITRDFPVFNTYLLLASIGVLLAVNFKITRNKKEI